MTTYRIQTKDGVDSTHEARDAQHALDLAAQDAGYECLAFWEAARGSFAVTECASVFASGGSDLLVVEVGCQ